MTAVAQKEARELLTSLTQTTNGRQTRPHEIADRLMSLIGNPNGSQFTGPMQLGQIDRVAPIRLDPVSWLAWINDGATTTQPCTARVNCR